MVAPRDDPGRSWASAFGQLSAAYRAVTPGRDLFPAVRAPVAGLDDEPVGHLFLTAQPGPPFKAGAVIPSDCLVALGVGPMVSSPKIAPLPST